MILTSNFYIKKLINQYIFFLNKHSNIKIKLFFLWLIKNGKIIAENDIEIKEDKPKMINKNWTLNIIIIIIKKNFSR